MIQDNDIANVMYAMTLEDRPRSKDKWVMGCYFNRLGKKKLFSYWKNRISTNPSDLDFFNKILSQYQRRREHPEGYAWLGENPSAKWLPKKPGLKLAAEHLVLERQRACVECQHFDPAAFGGAGRCVECWCPIISMTTIASSACPVGRWGAC
jgi:hypothetical protein